MASLAAPRTKLPQQPVHIQPRRRGFPSDNERKTAPGPIKEIDGLEAAILAKANLRPEYQYLLRVRGIGQVLSLTIALETADVKRVPAVGDLSSYCRCGGSVHRSNGKKKGSGNVKNGNRYLAWAFVEAANFAVRYDPTVKRLYQRNCARTKPVVAIKAVAHKPARGYQTLINQTLKKSLQQSDIETMIRKAIREELMSGKAA